MKVPMAVLLLVYTVGIGVAAGFSGTDVSSDSTSAFTSQAVSADTAVTTALTDTSQAGNYLTNATAAAGGATSVATSNATTSAEPASSTAAGGMTSVSATSASPATVIVTDNSTVSLVPSSGSATTATVALDSSTVTQAPSSGSATTTTSVSVDNSTVTQAPTSGSATMTTSVSVDNSTVTQAPTSGSATTTTSVSVDNSTITQAPTSGSATTTTSVSVDNSTVTQAPSSGSVTTTTSVSVDNSTVTQVPPSGNTTATAAAEAATLTVTISGNSSLTAASSSGGMATSWLASASSRAWLAASDQAATGDSLTSGAASGAAQANATNTGPLAGGSTASPTTPYSASFATTAAAGQASSAAVTPTGYVSRAADRLSESSTWSTTPEPASTSWFDAAATAGSPALVAASSEPALALYGSTGETSASLTWTVAITNGSMSSGGGGGSGAVDVTQSMAVNSTTAAITSVVPAFATGNYSSGVGVSATVTRVSGQTQNGTAATSGISSLPMTSNFTQKTTMSSAQVGNQTSTGKQGVTITTSMRATTAVNRSSVAVASASVSALNQSTAPTKVSTTARGTSIATNTSRSYNGTFAYVLLPEGPVIVSRSYNITCIASKAEITLTLNGSQVPLTGKRVAQGYYTASFEILTKSWHDGIPVDCYIVSGGVVYNDEKILIVHYGPLFSPSVMSSQNRYVVKPEQTLRLWCRGALSNPPATYTWGFPPATPAEHLADGGLMFTTSAAVPEYGAWCTAHNAYTLQNATMYYQFNLLQGVELALRFDRPHGYSTGQTADITCFLAYRQPIYKISLISDSDNDVVACSKQDPAIRLSSEWDVARVSVDFGVNDGRTTANYRECRSLPWSSTLLEYVMFHVYGVSSAAAGMYRCRVWVDSAPYTYADTPGLNITAQLVNRSVTSNAQRIRVFEMPTLPRISGPTDVNEDQSYTYTCTSRNGRPPPQLSWMLGDSYYVNSVNRQPRNYDLDSNQGDSFTSIVLADVTQSMDGQALKCVVTAHPLVDQRYFGAVRLNVNYGPRFRNPEDFDVLLVKSVYESLTLSCHVVSKPISRIMWTMQRAGLVSVTISSENYFNGGRDMMPSTQYKLPGYTNFTCVVYNPLTRKTISGSFRVYFTRDDYFSDDSTTQATTVADEVIILSSNEANDTKLGILLTAIPLILLVCILSAVVGTLAYVAASTRGTKNKIAAVRLNNGQKAIIWPRTSPKKVAAGAATAAATSQKHAHQHSPRPGFAGRPPATSPAGGSPGALRAGAPAGQVGGLPSPAVARSGPGHPPGTTRLPPAAASSPQAGAARAPAASDGPDRRTGALNQTSGDPGRAASSPDRSRRAAANQAAGHGQAATKTGSLNKSPPGVPGQVASRPDPAQPQADDLPPPPGGRDGQPSEDKTGKSASPQRQTKDSAKEPSRSRDSKPATASVHRQWEASKTAKRKKSATSVGAKAAAANEQLESKNADGLSKPVADPAQQPVNESPPTNADGATATRT